MLVELCLVCLIINIGRKTLLQMTRNSRNLCSIFYLIIFLNWVNKERRFLLTGDLVIGQCLFIHVNKSRTEILTFGGTVTCHLISNDLHN